MASPADAFIAWLERTGKMFAAPLHGFFKEIISAGLEAFMDIMGKSWAPKLSPLVKKMQENKEVPAELKPLFDEIMNPTGEVSALLGSGMAMGVVGGVLDRLLAPLLLPVVYAANDIAPNQKVGADVDLQWYLRHRDQADIIAKRLRMRDGYNDGEINMLFKLLRPIFPSDVVGPAALRDPKFEHYWEEVKMLGLDDQQIELLKEMAYRVPGVQDVIRYAVKEAYNEELTRLFRTKEEYPGVAEEDARKAGVRPDHLMKEWQAHWDLPSAGQGFQMLHRGIMTEADVTMLLKALDYMPYFRDKLIELSWDVPNRVELRLMARYGLVDKPFLVAALTKAGLHKDYRDVVADMMLAQGMLQDLSMQYGKKWLTSEEVKAKITAAGLSSDIADRMYKWIVANAGPERTAAQKDLTKSEIIKGVKQGVLSDLDAIDQLRELGYDEAEATYLLAIEVPQEAQTVSDELRLKVDTIRRQRRQRLISRDQEIIFLVQAGVDSALAAAYADNDDLRLEKAEIAEEAKETLKNQIEALKVDIDTIRRRRRQRVIDAATELKDLIELGVVDILAAAYVENDDLRLAKEAAGG